MYVQDRYFTARMNYEKAKLIVKEMTDQMVLDLVDKGLVTDQLVLTIGYDIENLSNPNLKYQYKGEVTIDRYGRKVPKHAHGTANLDKKDFLYSIDYQRRDGLV